MKTQIITLESHDDLISVRDKLSWAKTPRILLVWPKYEKVTLRVLDLKVLQRHADSLGAQLGLVTRRAKVRRDAESLGIPVFASTTTAQRNLWPDSAPRSRRIPKAPRRDLRKVRDSVYEKEAAWRTSLPGRVLTFTVGSHGCPCNSQSFRPARRADFISRSANSKRGHSCRRERINRVRICHRVDSRADNICYSKCRTIACHHQQISVPKSKSKGVARFTNLSQGEVDIPAGTVVATESSTRFVTLNDTRLPAGIDQFVDVPIEALEAGAQGNVAADTITIVEGSLGLSISVTNPNPIKGGANSQLIGATDEDRAKLRKVVMDNLRRDAEVQIARADCPCRPFIAGYL